MSKKLALATLLIIPALWLGWLHFQPTKLVPLSCTTSETPGLETGSLVFCGLARHYVTPAAKRTIMEITTSLRDQGLPTLQTLDASSRSGRKPLWPHLSHGDGRQLDVSLYFRDKASLAPVHPKNDLAGYGHYSPALAGEPSPCGTAKRPMDLGNPSANVTWELDEAATRKLILDFARHPQVRRVFLAPHLKARLQLQAQDKIRFAGCHAARHDDHLHVEFKE